MKYSRRELGKMALAVPAVSWIGAPHLLARAAGQAPRADFGGVNLGIITYSFRQIGYNPEDVLKGIVALGLRSVELEQSFFETYFGAPRDPTGGGQPQGVGSAPAGQPFSPEPEPVSPGAAQPEAAAPARGRGQGAAGQGATGRAAGAEQAAGGRGAAAGRGGGGGGRGALTPEQEAERAALRAELKKWRLSAPWDRVRTLRRLYDDAGVGIGLVKFPQLGGPEWSDEEVDYAFEMARTLGAEGLTCEPPLSSTKRLARFADRHRMVVGFHNHSNVTSVEAFGRTGAWEQAFFYSRHHWANVDIGHFTAGNGFPPTEFIREYHDRITNVHLKDRRINGPNVPWGEGDTPIAETLQLMKREGYRFMATIELEYPIPPGSSVMAELRKCVAFCRNALA
jgi:sugar phosphate isomerase/epimerase